MSKSVAYRHHLRALSRWPADPLRPEAQFAEVMRRQLDRRIGIPSPSSPPSSSPSDGNSSDSNKASLPPWDEEAELEKANALYSLVGNRYVKRYPLSKKLMEPPSNPTHYTDLVEELESAPSRSWWDRTVKRFQGMLRFS